MRVFVKLAGTASILLLIFFAVSANASSAGDGGSVVIVFKDGHRQTFAPAEIARIDFKTPSVIVYKDGHQEKLSGADIVSIEFGNPPVAGAMPGRAHFIGKWEVGQGGGSNQHFFITLEANGDARKTVGSYHGTWTLVDGEARVTWDDGWKDAIRKVGASHQKRAFEPGKSFGDEPSNITAARFTDARPL